jgi:hypothetical protein
MTRVLTVKSPRVWILILILLGLEGVARAQGFCGPNTTTYYRVDSNAGGAVMCVLFVDTNSFAFYAQGTEHNQTFRLLGYSYRDAGPRNEQVFNTSFATINGNGEQLRMAAHMGDNTFILSGGAWDEHNPPNLIFHHILESEGIWSKYEPGRQTSAVPTLPPIRSCGPNLETFQLQGRPGEVRCLWEANDHSPAAWIGAGSFNGKSYLHIGTAFFGTFGTNWGAADVCLPNFYCGRVNFGQLHLNTSQGGGVGVGTLGPRDRKTRYFVTGSWTETWVTP